MLKMPPREFLLLGPDPAAPLADAAREEEKLLVVPAEVFAPSLGMLQRPRRRPFVAQLLED